jgi:predicted thioesterase
MIQCSNALEHRGTRKEGSVKFPGIIIGDTYTVERTIEQEDTAGNFWTTEVAELLSTPSLVAMMMEASANLIDHRLPDGFISVGKSAEVTHEHPSVIGATVSVKVEIKSFDGYHIRLKMTASDESGIVGRGSHTRSIVNKKWLLIKLHNRMADL